MKALNDLIDNIGVDKALHYELGGWITALFFPFEWIGLLIGVVFTLLISIVKERYLDDEYDVNDIKFAMLGSLTSVIIYVLFRILL